jgi:hypothetical protein
VARLVCRSFDATPHDGSNIYIAGDFDHNRVSHRKLRTRIAPVENEAAFFDKRRKSLQNSHQNSHSTKIKMAADLAASQLVDFIGVLAPQVGLEPTTLRLTGES